MKDKSITKAIIEIWMKACFKKLQMQTELNPPGKAPRCDDDKAERCHYGRKTPK